LLTKPHNHVLHSLWKQLITETDGLQALQENLHISGKATAIILKSLSDGTHKQYKPYIKQWMDICSKWEADPNDPTLIAVLDFLVSLRDKGLT